MTPADVKKFAPEFSDLTNQRIQLFIDMAGRNLNSEYWGEKYNDGHMLLTSHYLTLGERQGIGGSISSEKVGDLAVSYAGVSDKSKFGQTSYGQMFEQMMKTLGPFAVVLECP